MNVQTSASRGALPLVAITLGDVAGIGPEIVAKGWNDPRLHAACRPIVIGDAQVLAGEFDRLDLPPHARPTIEVVKSKRWELAPHLVPGPDTLICWEASSEAVADLEPGRIHARAAKAAYDYLVAGIDAAQAGRIDALVTMPLNKEGLFAAGLHYPGHTEILAERTGSKAFGMMLYRLGLGVLHVTLHMALREVFKNLSTEAVLEKIVLLDAMMTRLEGRRPKLGVTALNPHASDGGIFGDEEATIILPAVMAAHERGISVTGPLPADTLFVRAHEGEFDGVVAMYHDQGHIALKLLGWQEAVNITVGLPIVRTSVAHGTGYDIVRTGKAQTASFFEAVRVAARLAATR